MTNRKKLITAVVSLTVVLCTLVGVAFALLIAKTEPITNTFTPSNITLTLTEDTVNFNGQMVPGKPIKKDVKVTIATDISCYVFVEVAEVNDAGDFLKYALHSDWKVLFTDAGTKTTVYYTKVEVADAAVNKSMNVLAEGKSEFTFGDKKVEYTWGADQVLVIPTITKEKMTTLYQTDGTVKDAKDLPTLTFKAYAIQSDHLAYTDTMDDLAKAQLAWDTLNADPSIAVTN